MNKLILCTFFLVVLMLWHGQAGTEVPLVSDCLANNVNCVKKFNKKAESSGAKRICRLYNKALGKCFGRCPAESSTHAQRVIQYLDREKSRMSRLAEYYRSIIDC